MPTIGVSIAVPEPWGRELQGYRVRLGDSTAELIPTHITLLPPHECSADEVALLRGHLTTVAATTAPFRIHLRGTGTFRPVSPVVFVGVVAGISQCEQLAGQVRRGPLRMTTRFPYHPHVTVAHDVGEERLDRAFRELAGFDCQFDVDAFRLYEFQEPAGWVPTEAFWLSGG